MTDKYYLLGILSDERAFKSRSPLMHEAALARASLKGRYVPLKVGEDQLKNAVAGLWALGFSGANVTVPYKERIMPFLNGLSPEAQAIGAVNTLVRNETGFTGHNTDARGFAKALAPWTTEGALGRVLVIGTGGVSRAALASLAGQDVFLTGRSQAKVLALAEEFQVNPVFPRPDDFCADIAINATSASSPRESPELMMFVNKTDIKKGIMDLNYGRDDNFWEQAARNKNLLFQDGLAMLAYQAQAAFQLWTGQNVPDEIFKGVL